MHWHKLYLRFDLICGAVEIADLLRQRNIDSHLPEAAMILIFKNGSYCFPNLLYAAIAKYHIDAKTTTLLFREVLNNF